MHAKSRSVTPALASVHGPTPPPQPCPSGVPHPSPPPSGSSPGVQRPATCDAETSFSPALIVSNRGPRGGGGARTPPLTSCRVRGFRRCRAGPAGVCRRGAVPGWLCHCLRVSLRVRFGPGSKMPSGTRTWELTRTVAVDQDSPGTRNLKLESVPTTPASNFRDCAVPLRRILLTGSKLR